jgi:hypothetical protein
MHTGHRDVHCRSFCGVVPVKAGEGMADTLPTIGGVISVYRPGITGQGCALRECVYEMGVGYITQSGHVDPMCPRCLHMMGSSLKPSWREG